MHIPDGLIPIDQAIIYWIIASVFLGLFFLRISKKVDMSKRIVLTAILTAAMVVVSSISIPSPFGIPMHFFLIPLVVILLGPLNAVLVAFLALLFQAIFLGLGGVTTLGANVLVMGVSLSLATYAFYKIFIDLNENLAIFISTFMGIVVATFMQILILLFTGTTSLEVLLMSLVPFYVFIAILEGVINILIISFFKRMKTDILNLEKV